MFEQILAFLGASILLTLSPGPDIVYVLVQSISQGKKAGIVTALGLVSGIIIHTTLLAFGISLLIKESPTLFIGIKIIGAFYLFYLAFKAYRRPSNLVFFPNRVPKRKAFELFKKGFVMNVINPKVLLFFLAFFPAFLWNAKHNTVFQFYVLGGIFMLQAFLIFLFVSLLAGGIAGFFEGNKRAEIIFKWLHVVVFTMIGIFILV